MCLKGLAYEEWLKDRKLQPLEKKTLWKQRNCSNSPEGQGSEENHLDCLIKLEEPAEDEAGLHAALLITRTVCHIQSHLYQSRYQKNIRHKLRINFALYSIFVFLGNLSVPDH